MRFSAVRIRPELKPYIQSFWVFQMPSGMPRTATNLSAPNGCPKLIIAYENWITSTIDGRANKCNERSLHFVGNRCSSALLQTSSRNTTIIGIEFHPHGAYPIFGLPMFQTANRYWAA